MNKIFKIFQDNRHLFNFGRKIFLYGALTEKIVLHHKNYQESKLKDHGVEFKITAPEHDTPLLSVSSEVKTSFKKIIQQFV